MHIIFLGKSNDIDKHAHNDLSSLKIKDLLKILLCSKDEMIKTNVVLNNRRVSKEKKESCSVFKLFI